jgi:hypothetical protein
MGMDGAGKYGAKRRTIRDGRGRCGAKLLHPQKRKKIGRRNEGVNGEGMMGVGNPKTDPRCAWLFDANSYFKVPRHHGDYRYCSLNNELCPMIYEDESKCFFPEARQLGENFDVFTYKLAENILKGKLAENKGEGYRRGRQVRRNKKNDRKNNRRKK